MKNFMFLQLIKQALLLVGYTKSEKSILIDFKSVAKSENKITVTL